MNARTFVSTSVPGLLNRYQASYRGLPRTAWIVATIVLVHNAGRMVTTFLAVYLFAELGLSEQWIGAIVTAYGGGAVLGSLIGGWLTARLVPKHIILISLSFLGSGFLVLSTVTDPRLFALLIFFTAIFDGMFRPPVMLVLMGSAAPAERTRCYALYQTSLNLGYATGAVIGGILAEIHFPLIFWVNGGASLVAAIILASVMKIASPPKAKKATQTTTARAGPGFNWPLLVLCIVGFLNYSVINQRLSIYPLYLTTDYGLVPTEYGALMMFNSLLIAGIGVTSADWLKQFDQRKVAAVGSLLLCGSFALLPLGTTLVFAFFTCVVVTFGEVMFMPSIVALVYGCARNESAGQSIGLFFAIHSSCRALGPVAGVWSFTMLGSDSTWLLCGVMGVLSAVLLLALLERCSGEDT